LLTLKACLLNIKSLSLLCNKEIEIMKKVSLKNCEPSLCNPEDKFNDLIEEGYSINEALLSIMEDAIVEQKIEENYPDYLIHSLDSNGDGNWDVELIKA
jgi:hypothetical protein